MRVASCHEISELPRVFRRHHNNAHVLVECIAVVGCLADMGSWKISMALGKMQAALAGEETDNRNISSTKKRKNWEKDFSFRIFFALQVADILVKRTVSQLDNSESQRMVFVFQRQ